VNPPAIAAQEKLIMRLDCYDLILNYAWINNQKSGSGDGPHLRARCSLFRFHSEAEVIEAANGRPSVWPSILLPRSGQDMRISSRLQAGLWVLVKEPFPPN
jgi:hypothetical protein